MILTEGELKALAITLYDLEAVAFTGISVFKICELLLKFILLRCFDTVTILYDADGLQIKEPEPEKYHLVFSIVSISFLLIAEYLLVYSSLYQNVPVCFALSGMVAV